jgi:ATP-binding cassette subfamily C protein
MKAERQLFGVLDRAAPALAVSWWALIVVRGLLPPAFALTMGVLVSAVQAGGPLGLPLATAGTLFLLLQTAGPRHDALSSNLGARATAWLHDRLLDACVAPEGLAHFENPELADRLAAARDFDAGITGPPITICMPNIGGGFAALAGGLAQALLLAGWRWWAPIVVGGAWLATHWLLRESGVWKDRNTAEVRAEHRHAAYAYDLAVEPPAAACGNPSAPPAGTRSTFTPMSSAKAAGRSPRIAISAHQLVARIASDR